MKIIIGVILAIVLFLVVMMWACLRVAAKEDEQIEQMMKAQKDKNKS